MACEDMRSELEKVEEEKRELERIEAEKEKVKRIKKEIKKLKVMFAELPDDAMKTALSLIENAAFMVVTLEDLQKSINRNGVVDTYQNGANQFGLKKSAAVEVYNTMIKNHVAVMKSLTDMIPKKQPTPKNDGFDDFVNGRDEV